MASKAARHSTFIEDMAERFGVEVDTIPQPTGGDIVRERTEVELKGRTNAEMLGLSPDDGAGDEGDLDEAPTVGKATIEAIGINRRTTLWRPVVGRPGVYEPSPIPSGNVRNCLQKRDERTGKRIFFLQRELPKDWVSIHDTEKPFSCADYVESCPKQLRNAEQLAAHVRGYHPEVYETYKEELDEMSKAEVRARRDARLAKVKAAVAKAA